MGISPRTERLGRIKDGPDAMLQPEAFRMSAKVTLLVRTAIDLEWSTKIDIGRCTRCERAATELQLDRFAQGTEYRTAGARSVCRIESREGQRHRTQR